MDQNIIYIQCAAVLKLKNPDDLCIAISWRIIRQIWAQIPIQRKQGKVNVKSWCTSRHH